MALLYFRSMIPWRCYPNNMTPSQTQCFHCGEPVLGHGYPAKIGDQDQLFCCIGCQSAALAINSYGLGEFYVYRDTNSERQIDSPRRKRTDFSAYDLNDIQASFVTEQPDGALFFFLQISGITCAACVWLIEQRLSQLTGVTQVVLNLSTHRLSVTLRPNQSLVSDIFAAVYDLGYSAKPWQVTEHHTHLEKLQKDFIIRIGIAGIGLMQIMMNTFATYLGDIAWEYENLLRWASLLFTLPVFFYAAMPFYRAALRDIRAGHFGMDVPVSLALILAFIPSVWATVNQSGATYFESVAMFTFFLLLGRFLEFRARLSLNRSGQGLDDLLPLFAHVKRANVWMDISSDKLTIGDIVVVKPGEKIPADGRVISGESQVNAATFTGEFTPVPVRIGDKVQAGTLNTDGLLTLSVTHAGGHSSMNQMLSLLEKAAAFKPKIARIADTGASYFVLFILALTVMTAIVWLTIDPDRAFWVALSVLVITCPCALSLATPVSLTASISAMRQLGVLPTQGEALTTLTRVDTVVFDKTGTLTLGEYRLTQQISVNDNALNIAASLEQYSEHPIALAFKNPTENLNAVNVEIVANAGIEGSIDGHRYRIGTAAFCFTTPPEPPPASTEGAQWIALSQPDSQTLIAWFEVQDSLRADARETVQGLINRGLSVHLVTGDPSNQGALLGQQLGITDIRTGATAADKLAYIAALQTQGKCVLMIGDGINDAPAMARADVAIAVAQGAELTQHTADILLLSQHLSHVLLVVDSSHKTHRIIAQNLAWGLIYNLVALPFAVMGFVTPWMAALGMSFSSLLVVFNALRLHRVSR